MLNPSFIKKNTHLQQTPLVCGGVFLHLIWTHEIIFV